MADGVRYCINLNWLRYVRVRSRSPVTFKIKLYVRPVNNSFQSLTIFVTSSSILDVTLQLCYKFLCGVVSKDTSPFDFNKCKRTNTRKRNTNTSSIQCLQYQITFILHKCYRSIDNSNDFYIFIFLWKGSW